MSRTLKSCSSDMRLAKPIRPSKASLAAVNPFWASNAALIPFSAACPACSGFVWVPMFCLRPEAREEAMPKALVV